MCGCPQEKIKYVFCHATLNWDSLWIVEIMKVECNNHLYRITIFELALRCLSNFLLSRCVKYPKMLAFSVPYFPVYGPNRILIFPYMSRIIESTTLSINGKMRIRFCPYTRKYKTEKAHTSGYFTQCQITKEFFLSLVIPLQIFAFWYERWAWKIVKAIYAAFFISKSKTALGKWLFSFLP